MSDDRSDTRASQSPPEVPPEHVEGLGRGGPWRSFEQGPREIVLRRAQDDFSLCKTIQSLAGFSMRTGEPHIQAAVRKTGRSANKSPDLASSRRMF